MPELPDVEGFRRTLDRARGTRVERIDVLDAGVLRDVAANRLRDVVGGGVVATPRRHGKFLIAPLRSGPRHRHADPSLVLHFGMTGRLDWVTDGAARHQHDRLVLVTSGGELRYRDLRKLQGVRLAGHDHDVADILGELGPDAASVTADEFDRRLSGLRRMLKPALMDQSVVAGLGNLLVDEILWQARIHPKRRTTQLDLDDGRLLHRTMRTVLRRSSSTGRVPDRDTWLTGHRDDDEGSCPRCGTRLARDRTGGRSTVFCPRCQPE